MSTIETERLFLRAFQPDDLEAYHTTIYSDPDVMQFLPGRKPRPKDQTEEIMQYFIEHGQRRGFSVWAVLDKKSGHFLGHAGLISLRKSIEVELAYSFGKPFWGQGFATEAARASLRFGFETAQLPRVLALAYPENLASQRVMQKTGMQHQGTTDLYYDATLVMYRMERESWKDDGSFYALR